MKLQDLLKDIVQGKVYTDKDRKPFKVNEGMRRFKVYVSGEKEPLILMGKNEREVKKLAHMMIKNSSVKIRKVVREGGPGSGPQGNGEDNPFDREPSDDELKDIEKQFESLLDEAGRIGGAIDMSNMETSWTAPKRETEKGGPSTFLQKFSSNEARSIVDGALKNWAKDLRKLQHRVIKDWMSAAKSGKIDFFDIIRGLKTGDSRRAHPYETEFLVSVLTKDKIINRFRKYFGGKKGKSSRTKKRR